MRSLCSLLVLLCACSSANIKSNSFDVNDFDEDTGTSEPESQPSSAQPSSEPSSQPESQPSSEPSSSSQPSSEPSSQPSSQPSYEPAYEPSQPTSEPSSGVLYYYTSTWSGSWTGDNTQISGSETYQYDLSQIPSQLDCDLNWNLLGTAVANPSCTDCLFEFDIVATFDTTSTVGSCSASATDLTFQYAYHENYSYTDAYGTATPLGNTLLYRGSTADSWSPFVAPSYSGNPTDPTWSSTISYNPTSGSFSYFQGPVNYEYYYSY